MRRGAPCAPVRFQMLRVLVEEDMERQQDRQDVSMGVMSHLEYRMQWYNEDEATARKNLPEQNRVME